MRHPVGLLRSHEPLGSETSAYSTPMYPKSRIPLLSSLLAALLTAAVAPAQELSNPALYMKSLEAAAQARQFYGRYDNSEEIERPSLRWDLPTD